MTEFEFTLKFLLPAEAADPEAHLGALGDAGCDDALVGVGQAGRIALDFTRAARSAFAAVGSALRDVRRAIPGAVLVEASPDFVGLTDVAGLSGCSRQNMRKLMLSHAGFPPAVHDGNPALWHLASVLEWLKQQRREVDPALLDLARATMKINIAKEARQLRGVCLPADLEPLFA